MLPTAPPVRIYGTDVTAMTETLYNTRILRLAAALPRTERLADPDITVQRTSRICGSRVTVDVKVEDGRIVVRNTFTYNPTMRTSRMQVERIGRQHDASFRARFPMLADVSMEYRWGGHLCLSLNSVPAFGEVEDGLYVAGCQNGLGTVKGTLAGKLIADLACGSNDPMVADMLGYDGPKRLYPEPFMTAGARGRLWWMHRRAGRDL